MSYLNALLSDLRDRKLWPVVAVLAAAVVAVPVLLSKHPAPAPASSTAGRGLPVQATHAGSVVTVEADASQGQVSGHQHNPFAPVAGSAGSGTSGSASSSTSGGGGSTTSGGGGSTTTVTSGTSSGTGVLGAAAAMASSLASSLGSAASGSVNAAGGASTPSSSGPSASGGGSSASGGGWVAPVSPAAPSRSGSSGALTSTESYRVAISQTTADGGVQAIDPLARLGVLPSSGQPLLAQLGVLQGGQRVLFAVVPGASLSGPGSCTPGPLDCEVLALSPGQIERVSGGSASVLFEVASITAHQDGSVAAARQARAQVSQAGSALVDGLTSQALALFTYEPALGVVVDQRNLTVGGN